MAFILSVAKYQLTRASDYIKIVPQQQEKVMKILIKSILLLHVLPLFVLCWLTLFDLARFSSLQWGIAWFLTSASAIILTVPSLHEDIEKDNDKK